MAVAADYNAVAEQLYIAYFGRPADRDGLANMSAALLAGGTPTDIGAFAAAYKTNATVKYYLDAFGSSTESANLYTGSDSEFVTAVYQNVLNRDPLLAGLDFWTNALATKAITRAELAAQVMAIAVKPDGNPVDAAIVANKVIVAGNFTAAIDTAAEINAYRGKDANQVARDMLHNVSDTTDTTAFNQSISDALAKIVDLKTPTTTSTLTVGVDTIPGTSGNDIINAVLGTAAHATLTAFDSIDGGAGKNTLNIVDTDADNGTTHITSMPSGVTIKNIQTINVSSAEAAGTTIDTSSIAGVTNLNINASLGADTITAATTTAVLVNVASVGTNATNISGGSTINATIAGVSTGASNIGSSTTAGAITAIISDVAGAAGVSAAGGVVTVTGGTTVNVTQNIAAGVSNATAATTTGGAINVVGGAATTAVIVKETAAVAAVAASAGVTESSVVTWQNMTGNGTQSIGGMTVTNATGGAVTAAQVATVAGGGVVAGLTVTTAPTLWTVAAAAGATNVFTSVTANTNVADITGAANTVGTVPGAVTTQGAAVGATGAGSGGIAGGTVTVTDSNSTDTTGTKANTIKTVSLDGYGAGSAVNSNALTTLSLANSSGVVTVTDNSATVTNTTLGVTVNKLGTGAGLTDNTIKTLNVTASGAASKLNVTGAALTAVTVAGDQKLDLTGSTAALVTAFTSTNTGGVTVALNAGSTGSFGAGADTVTIAGGATKAVTLGAGNDTAIVTTLGVGATIDGGTGTNTLSISAANAAAASLSNTFAGQVTNFQSLTLTGATNQTVDLGVLGGYTSVSTSGGNGLTLNTVASGATLTLTDVGTAYTVAQTGALAGTADVLNVVLTAAASTNFASTGLTAANVETIKITANDTSATPAGTVTDTFVVLGNDAKSITVSGTAHTALTAASTALTSFDASGLVVAGAGAANTGITWTAGALAASATAIATIKGSANGGDVIDASASLKGVTITEVKGANTIYGAGAVASTLTGGSGADHINGGSGKDVIVGGGGADVINGGNGADLITLSGSTSTIVQGPITGAGTAQGAGTASGLNTANVIQTSELTSTFDVVKGAVAGTKLDLSAFAATATAVDLAATNLAGSAGRVEFASGTYDAVNGVFNYGAAGADTVVTYDHGAGVFESIVLVGFHAGSTTAIAGGIVTLG